MFNEDKLKGQVTLMGSDNRGVNLNPPPEKPIKIIVTGVGDKNAHPPHRLKISSHKGEKK